MKSVTYDIIIKVPKYCYVGASPPKIGKINFQWILLNYKVQNCKCPKMQYEYIIVLDIVMTLCLFWNRTTPV